MLSRKVEKDIKKWIAGDHRALLVDGARQVGKTYTIRQCLTQADCDFVEVNLIADIDSKHALSAAETVTDLVINLSAVTGHEFKKNNTVIFIDEVQEFPDIVTKIKFWVDEGSYRYVLSGSLLGIELRSLRSAPVGYVHEIKMYPLDFEEFLSAVGVREEVLRHLRLCFEKKSAVGEVIHQKLMKLFGRYLVVGGMPQAVEEFINSSNIERVSSIQRDIIKYYKRDYSKYEKDDKKLLISSIYDSIPSQLLRQNRRFNYSDIKKGLRFAAVENTFLWLYRAGVVLPSFNVTEPRVALKLNEKSSLVKLYYSDVGLLTCALGDAIRRGILFEESTPNLGGIYENAVIQEITAHGFDVYYYNSKKMGELDFLIEYQGRILPIEVKSGKDYYIHSAINNVLEVREFDIEEAYIFTSYDVRIEGRVIYFPVYMASFLKSGVDMPVLEDISI